MPMKLMKQNKGWRPLGRLFASWIFGLIPDRHRYCTYLYYLQEALKTLKQQHHLKLLPEILVKLQQSFRMLSSHGNSSSSSRYTRRGAPFKVLPKLKKIHILQYMYVYILQYACVSLSPSLSRALSLSLARAFSLSVSLSLSLSVPGTPGPCRSTVWTGERSTWTHWGACHSFSWVA